MDDDRGVAKRLASACGITDRRKALLWSVILAWGNFAILYRGVTTGNETLTAVGMGIMALACLLPVLFG